MGFFIAGFLLGLATSWLWFCRLSPGRGFQQLLQKETDQVGYFNQIDQASQRMDCLEERCRRLEKRLAGSAGENIFREAGLIERNTAGRKREQALALWEEGWELNEIVRRTGLSRGEIELILSLQERH